MKKALTLAVFLVAFATASAQSAKEVLNQAMEYYNAGNCIDAAPLFDELIAVESLTENKKLDYSLNYYGGYCSRYTGSYENASVYMKHALELATELGYRDQHVIINMFLGEIEKELSNYKAAEGYYLKAISLMDKDSSDAATAMYYLAETYRSAKDYKRSIEKCQDAMVIAKQKKLIALEIACLTSTGEVYNESGDYSAAIRTFTQALTMSHNAQLPLEIANINLGFGLVYQALEKNDLARQHYEEALKFYVLCVNVTNIPIIVDRLTSLPPCTKAQAARAVETYKTYAETFSGMNDEESALQIELLVGHYQQIAGDDNEAALTYNQVFNVAMVNDFPAAAYLSAIALSDLLYENRSLEDALEVLVQAQQYQSVQNPPVYLPGIFAQKAKLYKRVEYYTLAENSYISAINACRVTEEKQHYQAELESMLKNITPRKG